MSKWRSWPRFESSCSVHQSSLPTHDTPESPQLSRISCTLAHRCPLPDSQPDLAKSLLEQIRESHQDYIKVLDGTSDTAGRGAKGGSGGGGEAAAGAGVKRDPGDTSGGSGAGGGAPSAAAWVEADALALVPLFAEQTTSTGEMNFLNNTGGAMSLAADVAGIARSIGQGGISLAGFLRDLGHTCCSSTAALRQAIRVSRPVRNEPNPLFYFSGG